MILDSRDPGRDRLGGPGRCDGPPSTSPPSPLGYRGVPQPDLNQGHPRDAPEKAALTGYGDNEQRGLAERGVAE